MGVDTKHRIGSETGGIPVDCSLRERVAGVRQFSGLVSGGDSARFDLGYIALCGNSALNEECDDERGGPLHHPVLVKVPVVAPLGSFEAIAAGLVELATKHNLPGLFALTTRQAAGGSGEQDSQPAAVGNGKARRGKR